MSPQESPGKDVRVSHEINAPGPPARVVDVLQRTRVPDPCRGSTTASRSCRSARAPRTKAAASPSSGKTKASPRIEDALRACGEDAGLSPDSAFVVFHAHGERRFPFVPEKEEA